MKYIYSIAIAVVVSCALAGFACAAVVQTATVSDFVIDTYGDVGSCCGGDVLATFNTGVAGCEQGLFLKAGSPGSNIIYQLLLTARTTNKSVNFFVQTTKVWPGSPTGHWCEAWSVSMNP